MEHLEDSKLFEGQPTLLQLFSFLLSFFPPSPRRPIRTVHDDGFFSLNMGMHRGGHCMPRDSHEYPGRPTRGPWFWLHIHAASWVPLIMSTWRHAYLSLCADTLHDNLTYGPSAQQKLDSGGKGPGERPCVNPANVATLVWTQRSLDPGGGHLQTAWQTASALSSGVML
ncbi:hypothetical protein V8C44DRAFT_230762 [Trichoderma aethiopicum]